MPKVSVLADIVDAAIGAKVHYEVWWAQASLAKPRLLPKLNQHPDFFKASYDAHYIAFHVYLATLFDRTKNTSSLRSYLKEINGKIAPAVLTAWEAELDALTDRAQPVIRARHKTVAHIDATLTEKEVFQTMQAITYDQTRDLIYDTADFVAKISGHGQDPGTIGIPHNNRLIDSTIRMIESIK